MFRKWQWVIAGKGVQPDNIYCCVHILQKSREVEQGKRGCFDYLTNLWRGDFLWHNMYSSKTIKALPIFGRTECRGRWCSRKPFYFTVDFVAMNDKDKGPWGEKKEGVSEWDSKDQKYRKSRVSGRKHIVLKYFELCPSKWWQDSIANWHFSD